MLPRREKILKKGEERVYDMVAKSKEGADNAIMKIQNDSDGESDAGTYEKGDRGIDTEDSDEEEGKAKASTSKLGTPFVPHVLFFSIAHQFNEPRTEELFDSISFSSPSSSSTSATVSKAEPSPSCAKSYPKPMPGSKILTPSPPSTISDRNVAQLA